MVDAKTFKDTVLNKGYISLDDGELFYVMARVNKENFPDMWDKLEKQLKDEGKYNYYIGMICHTNKPPFQSENLPVYGSREKFITKWFKETPNDILRSDIRCKDMGLLKRANN